MSLGHECDIVTQSCPLHLTIETPWGMRCGYRRAEGETPWGMRCGYRRAEDFEGETWDQRHGPDQDIGAEGTRA